MIEATSPLKSEEAEKNARQVREFLFQALDAKAEGKW
jgi:hypothetical protein